VCNECDAWSISYFSLRQVSDMELRTRNEQEITPLAHKTSQNSRDLQRIHVHCSTKLFATVAPSSSTCAFLITLCNGGFQSSTLIRLLLNILVFSRWLSFFSQYQPCYRHFSFLLVFLHNNNTATDISRFFSFFYTLTVLPWIFSFFV